MSFVNVVALSEYKWRGFPLQLVKRKNADRNSSVERSFTISRWIPWVDPQVKRAIHCFSAGDVESLLDLTRRGPAQSSPVWAKGGKAFFQNSGRSAIFCWHRGLLIRLHFMQDLVSALTAVMPLIIRYFWRRCARVWFGPAWRLGICASLMINRVRWDLSGRMMSFLLTLPCILMMTSSRTGLNWMSQEFRGMGWFFWRHENSSAKKIFCSIEMIFWSALFRWLARGSALPTKGHANLHTIVTMRSIFSNKL